VAVARMFSDTFAGIAPASVLPFIAMQLAGGVLAAVLIRLLYLHPEQAAADMAAVDTTTEGQDR
jgi:glycerol uptake facilitator-like aquaporin